MLYEKLHQFQIWAMTQQGDQTRSACCAPQRYDFSWLGWIAATVFPGLKAQFSHFTLLFCRGRQRNVPRIITHMNDLFSSLNLLFSDRSRWRCGRFFLCSVWRAWRRLSHRQMVGPRINSESSPAFSVRLLSSVGRVTVDPIRRSWVRFPPRSK